MTRGSARAPDHRTRPATSAGSSPDSARQRSRRGPRSSCG
jgi:hypothetical protein